MARTVGDQDFEPINPETICAYGESKVYFDPHVFIWKIEDFVRVFKTMENNLVSPEFEGRKDTKWRIRLQGCKHDSETVVKAHLYLRELKQTSPFKKTGISVRFLMSLLDVRGIEIREPLGGSITCLFQEFHGWSIDRFLNLKALSTTEKSLLSDGNLIIKCLIQTDYKVIHQSCLMEQIRFLKPSMSPSEQLSADFLDLFNKPELSDLVIKVNQNSFRVHKAVLVARCPVFREMFRNKKPQESLIRISSYDADVVQTMLEYLYCGEPINKNIILAKKSQMLRIASEYQLQEFLKLCDSFIADNMTVDNAFEVLLVAEETKRKDLMNKAVFLINWSKSSIDVETFLRISKTAPHLFKYLYEAE